MIKEWCEECEGVGEVQNVGLRERINEIFECPNCQGKGYTGLEPIYEGEEQDLENHAFLQMRTEKQIQVYIKEVKGE